MNKYIALFLIVIMVFGVQTTLFAAGVDDGLSEYCAFKVGQSDDADYDEFCTRMNSLGYNSIFSKTNNSSSYDITASDMRYYSDNSDYAYFSGHGHRRANIPIYKRYTDSDYYQYFCAESKAVPTGKPITEIGAEFKSGSTTKTESYWYYDLEWAIMSCCSQLNYGSSQGDGNYWNNLNSSQIWARTLLGSGGGRTHGILGYYLSAPGAGTDTTRINDFFDYVIDDGWFDSAETMINAWKKANEPLLSGSSTWAAICHRSNSGDYMDTQGTITPDTADGSTYTIDRYSYGGNNQNISLAYNKPLTVLASLSNDISVLSNFKLSFNSIDNIAKSNPKTFNGKFNSKLKFGSLDSYPNIKKGQSLNSPGKNINKDKIKSKILGDKFDDSSVKDNEEFYKKNNKILKISNNGIVDFEDTSIKFTDDVLNVDRSGAIGLAKSTLKDLDLLPEEDYTVYVSSVERNTMTFEEGNVVSTEKPEIVEYDVNFVRNLNGIPLISKDGEGIKVEICNKGIKKIKHNWRKVDKIETCDQKNLINQDIAMKKCVDAFGKVFDSPDNTDYSITSKIVYVNNETEITPAWSFDIYTQGFHCGKILINAITGDLMR